MSHNIYPPEYHSIKDTNFFYVFNTVFAFKIHHKTVGNEQIVSTSIQIVNDWVTTATDSVYHTNLSCQW